MPFGSLAFHTKLRILRYLTRLLAWLDRKRHPVSTLTPSSQISIPSTLSASHGDFDLYIYHPPGYRKKKETPYPIIITLHGGGWCVGHARHDERFIETLTQRGNAVVAAVNYRLAPEHPYPVPLLDCVDAMLYIWKNATALGIDKHRTYITGFSVGGTMAFASQYWLTQAATGAVDNKYQHQHQHQHSQIDPTSLGTIKGITAFYPPMDLTKTRAERAASNPAFMALDKKPASSSKLIGDIFDRAYFWNMPDTLDKSQMCISPGLAPVDMMGRALPDRIFIKLAGLDPLLVEGDKATAQFEAAGKHVECEVVENVPHYWDHLGKTEGEKALRQRVYENAVDEIEGVLGMGTRYM